MIILEGENLSSELKAWINGYFHDDTLQKVNMDDKENAMIVLESWNETKDTRTGCLVAQSIFGQVHIKYLVVVPGVRKKGVGFQLIKAIEEVARTKNSRFMYVETFSFQAPQFYMKYGFQVDFIRSAFDHDISYYYLSKILT
jgi:GNAT superfamily N-acetyltransferase